MKNEGLNKSIANNLRGFLAAKEWNQLPNS